jgi:hypothetical protein
MEELFQAILHQHFGLDAASFFRPANQRRRRT